MDDSVQAAHEPHVVADDASRAFQPPASDGAPGAACQWDEAQPMHQLRREGLLRWSRVD